MASDDPVVSIVVPVFNAARFIDAAVDSVLEQTLTSWELILVDDGSQDDSPAICAAHAARDCRIRVLSRPNRGPAAARNAGMRVAQGRYITFLDADDSLFPDSLETLVAEAELSGAAMVLGNFSKRQGGVVSQQPAVFSPAGAAFTGATATLEGDGLLDYVRHFLTTPSNHLVSYCWARLYRRAIIEGHDLAAREDMKLFEDLAFNLDYMGKVGALRFVNKPVYLYQMHDGHISASMALLDSAQLAHDMEVFRQKIGNLVTGLNVDTTKTQQVMRETGHALVHYAIIFLVRTCRQMNADNREHIMAEIGKLVAAPILRSSLSSYRPRPGNSRIVPWLIRLRLTRVLAAVCRWKGQRRYGPLAGGAR